MPITYTIDHERGLINEVWTGDVRSRDLEAYWTGYLADPEVLRIRRTLVDVRDAIIHITAYEMSVLVGNVVFPVLYDKKLKWKTAIVVKDREQFKVSRVYQALAEYYSEDAIFDSIDRARQFLLLPEVVAPRGAG